MSVMPPSAFPGSTRADHVDAATIHRVTGVLLQDKGFLWQQTTGTFDKGLDLLVMPRVDDRALPAIAALQVKGGDSQTRISVGNHRRYWSEMPMPVFGVVIPTSSDALWVDLRAYLRAHPTAKSVKPREPLASLPDAIRAAYDEHSGVLSLIDLGAEEPGRQLGALFALWPLRNHGDVVALVRGRLPRLAALPTRLALELLATSISTGGAAAPLWADEVGAIADSVVALTYEEVGDGTGQIGEHPEDSWRWGASYLWNLVERTGTAPDVVLAAAERSSTAESFDLCVHMAACMQPAASTLRWIAAAVRARPYLNDHPDLHRTWQALQDDDGPLEFPWGL